MGLILKYVIQTKAGSLHYRRRFPKGVAGVVGKGEFKRFLGFTAREALRNYPKVNAEFERIVGDAQKRVAGLPKNPTPLDIHREAERRAAELAGTTVTIGGRTLPASDPEAADIIRDSYLSSFSEDPETGEPIGVPEVEGRAVSILASGGRLSRPAPTIEDAKRLYIQERVTGDINETAKAARVERIMGHLSAASVEKNRPLANLTREDARNVRDYLLRDLRMNPATARRYLNDVRAVINHGITEFGLRNTVNPFLNLPIRLEVVARNERDPIPEKLLPAIRERIAAHAGADLSQIWRIIENTGCRLGEVTGLLVPDVFLDADIPYIDLTPHPHRRLKNVSSVRRVPLIGEALKAAQEAVKAAGDGPFLFVRYGRARGSDAASAILMKHVRAVTDEPKIVVHSLRHTMEDRLIRARVSEYDRNMVLGHSNRGQGDRYGGPDTRLEVAAEVVRDALSLKRNGRGAGR